MIDLILTHHIYSQGESLKETGTPYYCYIQIIVYIPVTKILYF